MSAVDFRVMRSRKVIETQWLQSTIVFGQQFALAKAIGLSQGRVSRAITGAMPLPEKHVAAVAKFAGVQLDDIPLVVDTRTADSAHNKRGGHLQAQPHVPHPDSPPVSIPGGSSQEGRTVNMWAEKAYGFVNGLKTEAEQEAALDTLYDWQAKRHMERTALHPAAGRSVRLSRKK